MGGSYLNTLKRLLWWGLSSPHKDIKVMRGRRDADAVTAAPGLHWDLLGTRMGKDICSPGSWERCCACGCRFLSGFDVV